MGYCRYILLLILSLTAFFAFSENKDSSILVKALNQSVTDIQKVKANLDLFEFYTHKDLPKALTYAKQAHSLSIKVDYKDGIAKADCSEGEINFLQGNFDEAKILYNEALSIYNELKNQFGIAESYSGLGKIAYKLGEVDVALTYFDKALNI